MRLTKTFAIASLMIVTLTASRCQTVNLPATIDLATACSILKDVEVKGKKETIELLKTIDPQLLNDIRRNYRQQIKLRCQ